MSKALYRRYRPDAFSDVIGQEHVTTPLMAALSKNRVNHAYLFSGPRGCGKTTSARILARCLNCAQGPTAEPCGTCDSCLELATGGSGSLDVIEIDAASHGGVDDARDLRERATFAPVRDRYKIFIIDEAHMVTSAGFNALLKIVEEPPEHIKFIFATTEPDKVIGTIKSRTHHYPFRLVPPEPLMAYLERLCSQENMPVAPGVLSLVIRAGGGSVRDSLSVLDQLMAGAGPEGLDYELAVSLLGYTHATLLDDVVDAMAAQDAATVFSAVDRVIQTGHDPRRFVEDLLERFRDLIIVKAMPESASQVIRGLPEDQLHRMTQQATLLGHAELSRSADVTNQALTEMTGATSPRLHLELLCARLLLPASDTTERGINARVDRIERRLSYAGDVPEIPAGQPSIDVPVRGAGTPQAATGFESTTSPQGAAAVREALRAARGKDQPTAVPTEPRPVEPAPTAASTPPDTEPPSAAPQPAEPAAGPQPVETETAAPSPSTPTAAPQPAGTPQESSADWGAWGPVDENPSPPAAATPANPTAAAASTEAPAPTENNRQRPETAGPADGGSAPSAPEQPVATPSPTREEPSTPINEPAAQPEPSAEEPTPGGTAGTVEMFRRAWPEIMDALREERKFVWLTIQPHASLAGFDGRTLTVAFANPGPMKAFSAKQENIDLLRGAINHILGVAPEIVITGGGSVPAGGSGPKAERRPAPASRGPVAQNSATAAPTHAPSTSSNTATAAGPPAVPAPTAHVPAAQPPAAPAPGGSKSEAPAASGPAAALRQHRAATTSARPSRGAPDRSPDEGPTDFGPEPEDDGGYDWGSDTVPVAPWDEPSGPATPAAEPPTQRATRPEGETWQRPEPAAPVPAAPTPSTPADQTAGAPAAPAPAAPAPVGTSTPAAPAPAGSASPVAPAPADSAAPVAPAPGAVAPPSAPAVPEREAPQPTAVKPMSRYQQLLNQARGKDQSASNTQGIASGGGATPPRPRTDVESTYVEDIPSDDDISIEESGVVGRPAIERLLNGRLIEERNHNGTPII
ncbi:DNA polymerase III subunit gamma and tau [Arthrobacter rhombi]|uniref:DNA polymerase III subunit gamma and tau n=1 Tax=Arthrobacter rhombi TaxID=71253 RepID=UPI003FD1A65B